MYNLVLRRWTPLIVICMGTWNIVKEFRFSYYDYVDELRLAWKSPYLNMMQSNSSLSHYNTESARDHI
jgi:hypothetical protein